jgi:hypothetical protein
VDRLKPHQGSATVVPAQPPLRGRPPRQPAAADSSSDSPPVALSLGGAPVEAAG